MGVKTFAYFSLRQQWNFPNINQVLSVQNRDNTRFRCNHYYKLASVEPGRQLDAAGVQYRYLMLDTVKREPIMSCAIIKTNLFAKLLNLTKTAIFPF